MLVTAPPDCGAQEISVRYSPLGRLGTHHSSLAYLALARASLLVYHQSMSEEAPIRLTQTVAAAG